MLRALTAGVCLAVLASGASGAAELKIGVVNVDEILARYKKADDIRKAEEEKLRAERKKIAERSRDYKKRVAEFEADGTSPGDPGKRKVERELELERFLLQRDVRDFQQRKQQSQDRINRRITDEVVAVCARIAKADGYDLILKRSAPGKTPTDDRAQILAFQFNAVLYAAPSIDMTTRVLEALEDAYSRGIKLVPDRPETNEPRPEGSTRSEGPADDPVVLSPGRSTDDAPAGSPGTLWRGAARARGDGGDPAPKERPTTGEGGRG